jgi:hypothetical protein
VLGAWNDFGNIVVLTAGFETFFETSFWGGEDSELSLRLAVLRLFLTHFALGARIESRYAVGNAPLPLQKTSPDIIATAFGS